MKEKPISETRGDPTDSLVAFRQSGGRAKPWRQPIPLREKLVVGLAAGVLVTTGWCLGGVKLWGQVSLGLLGLAVFLVAQMPLRIGVQELDRWEPLKRLVRFPVFWLGGLFMLYVACQQLNPAWVYHREGSRWWLERVAHIGWLPSGVEAPLRYMNGWRCLIWMGGAWLLVCALATAIQHRRSALFLCWVAVLNATVFAVVGIGFKLSGTRKLLGFVPNEGARSFFGSFYYSNHAGAWLVVGLGTTLGLSLYCWIQAQRKGAKSNPGFFLLMLAFVQLSGLLFSGSRGSVLTGIVLFAVYTGAGFYALARSQVWNRTAASVGILTTVIVAVFGFLVILNSNYEKVHRDMLKGLQNVVSLGEMPLGNERRPRLTSEQTRLLMARATADLWQDAPVLGNGLGAYRHLIVIHQKKYDPIYIHPFTYNQRRNPEGRVLTWRLRYAHTDWLQYLSEVGVAGSSLLVAVVGAWLVLWMRRWRNWTPGHLVWAATFGGLIFYAAVDFILWSPSVYFAFVFLPLLTLKTLR